MPKENTDERDVQTDDVNDDKSKQTPNTSDTDTGGADDKSKQAPDTSDTDTDEVDDKSKQTSDTDDTDDTDISELERQLEETRNRIKELNKENQKRRHQLRDWEELQESGVDPTTVKDLLKKQREEEVRKKEEEGRYRELLQEIEEQSQNEIQRTKTEAEQKVEKMRKNLEKYFIDKTVSETLNAEGASVKLLGKHIKEQVKVVEDENGDFHTVVVDKEGNPRLKRGGVDFTITDLVNEMKNDDDFAKAFPAPDTSGSGSDASTGSKTKVPASVSSDLRRSKMSPKDKYEFQKEHGMDEYLKLPM